MSVASWFFGFLAIIFLLVLIIFGWLFLGVWRGVDFGSDIFLDDVGVDFLEGESGGERCVLSLSDSRACLGERVEGVLEDGGDVLCGVFSNDGSGWSLVYVGVTGGSGVLRDGFVPSVVGSWSLRALCDEDGSGGVSAGDCLSNSVSLVVEACPVDGEDGEDGSGGTGWSGGEVIVSDEDDVLISGGGSVELDLGDIVEGNCTLGARVKTQWDYVSESACVGVQGVQSVMWTFYDSHAGIWHVVDTAPVVHSEEFCGLYWDGTPWRLDFAPVLNLPECVISAHYKLEAFVCECE